MKHAAKVLLFILAFFVVAAFWQHTLLTLSFLILIGIAMNMLTDWKYLKSYVVCALLGSTAEIVCIHYGVWHYTSTQLLSIPIWLPFVWGMAAVFFTDLSIQLHELSKN